MGLIAAALSSVSSTLADQWKEFFTCDAIDKDVLVVRGTKMTKGGNKGNDNVISNGSGIVVADGQCMIIVDQGKVVEICAEPGQFTYDSSSSPSIFAGKLGESILATFKELGARITYGGDVAKDQRVYYFNTKEIIDNKIGTPAPVPFRVVDANANMDMDIGMRMNAIYTYKVTNPILFYTNVCGNVANTYDRSEIDSTLKAELLAALQPAFAKISEQGIRYSAIAGHTLELEQALKECLAEKWANTRGLQLASFSINSITADPEDEKRIKQLQFNASFKDPGMAGAHLVGQTGQAMVDAANNSAGAAVGLMGVNMVNNMGTVQAAQGFFNQAAQQQAAQAPAADSWVCPKCGATNSGNFCGQCATPKPAPAGAWVCPKCGTTNTGNFCGNCATPKP
ncbi:MAG: SPFH domain-containing protein [Lachnospiraceae bacterium]|nr:SPFH domain-containing protein [Lachnospiraceae bacterium]